MVVEGRRIIPRRMSEVVQSSRPHGLVGQEIKCLTKALKLDYLDIDLIIPSFISITLFYFILTMCTFILNSIPRLVLGVKTIGIYTFMGTYVFLLFSGVFSGYLYMLILKRSHIGTMAHTYCVMYSLVYFPLGPFLIGLFGEIGFMFSFFGISLLSVFFLQGSITKGETYSSEKQRFLYGFAIFLSQSAIVYIGLVFFK